MRHRAGGRLLCGAAAVDLLEDGVVGVLVALEEQALLGQSGDHA